MPPMNRRCLGVGALGVLLVGLMAGPLVAQGAFSTG